MRARAHIYDLFLRSLYMACLYEYAFLFVRDFLSLSLTQTNTRIFDECSYVSNHNLKVNTKEISLVAAIYLGEKNNNTNIQTRARSNVIFDEKERERERERESERET